MTRYLLDTNVVSETISTAQVSQSSIHGDGRNLAKRLVLSIGARFKPFFLNLDVFWRSRRIIQRATRRAGQSFDADQ